MLLLEVLITGLLTTPISAFHVLQLLPRPAHYSPISSSSSPSNTRLSSSSSSEPAAEEIPFFATMFDAGDGVGSSGGLKEGKASITNRLPLGKIFDSRDYIFNTATNIRGYEWTAKETEELFDDLLDSSRGKFGMNQQYELSQIVLFPMSWDRDALGLGCRYDVYDGQQRLVTLCLIFAALRDSFKDSDSHYETSSELANMLNPTKVRKDDVLRIELNKRDNEVLTHILKGSDDMDNLIASKTFLTNDNKKISNAQRRIVQNYHVISAKVNTLSEEERLDFLDGMIENVYLLVCLPESSTIARNIVMGQGKGKDNEVIDDFKGLVCFRYIQSEDSMYKTFDEWDKLASTVDVENGAVGREIVSDACLLRAVVSLRSKISRQKQLYELERWFRNDISSFSGKKKDLLCEGDTFFKEKVKPASLALAYIRFEDVVPTFGFTKKLQDVTVSRLNFLQKLINGVPGTKEVEVVALELFLRYQGSSGAGKPMSAKDLDSFLHITEQFALFCAVSRPSTSLKYEKCFALLDAIDGVSTSNSFELLTVEERANLREGLSIGEFGATAGGKRFMTALMKRLNDDVLLKNKSGESSFSDGGNNPFFLETILPRKATKKEWGDDWPEKTERDLWVNRIGNFCLVSHKASTKEIKANFAVKRKRYSKENTWPLTEKLSLVDNWNKEKLAGNNLLVVDLIEIIWMGLKPFKK